MSKAQAHLCFFFGAIVSSSVNPSVHVGKSSFLEICCVKPNPFRLLKKRDTQVVILFPTIASPPWLVTAWHKSVRTASQLCRYHRFTQVGRLVFLQRLLLYVVRTTGTETLSPKFSEARKVFAFVTPLRICPASLLLFRLHFSL